MPAEIGKQAIIDKFQNLGTKGLGLPTYGGTSAVALAGRIVRGALLLLGVIFFALTVYAGILYLTAGGNEEQVKKATTILKSAVIGLFIVIFAGAITQFVVGYAARRVVPPQPSGATSYADYMDIGLWDCITGACPDNYSCRLDAPEVIEDQGGMEGAVCARD